MMNPVYFSSIADEDIINLSICVKNGETVRNIQNEFELFSEFIVFACNVEPVGKEIKHVIKKGEPVRWIKI